MTVTAVPSIWITFFFIAIIYGPYEIIFNQNKHFMKKIAGIVLWAIFVSTSAPLASAQTFSADLVVVNANIHTMSSKHPTATSLAVVGNRIVAVGTDADIKSMIGASTKVIDAKGRL